MQIPASRILLFAVAVLLLAHLKLTDAKEVLPPEAYVNRTVYPPIIKYDPNDMPQVSLGVFSDVQYAEKDEMKRRHFRLSKTKLEQAVDEMNENRTHLDFVVHLGDLVDDAIERWLPPLQPILKKLKYPLYQVLGNHDFLGTDEKKFSAIHKMLGMPSRYYSFLAGPEKKYRFVVLDGNDIALYSTVTGSPERKLAEETHYRLKRIKARNANKFNGALGKPQLEWLTKELNEASNLQQRVIVMLHHPMRPKNEPTNLWNDLEVVPMLTSYPCVVAVLNGHAHKFLYDFHHTKFRDVHFVTFGGMVQSPFTSFGFVDIYEDKLHVHGLVFGRAISYSYDIREKGPTGLPKETAIVGGKNGVSFIRSTPHPTVLLPPKSVASGGLNETVPAFTSGDDASMNGVWLARQAQVLVLVVAVLLVWTLMRFLRRAGGKPSRR